MTDDRKKPGVPPDEARLFERAMHDAKRLHRRPSAPQPGAAAPGAPPSAPSSAPPSAPSHAVSRAPPPGPVAAQARPLAPLGAGAAVDVDRRTLDRLRRGRLRPEARVDLHGMTQAQAHSALCGFILRAQSDGRRCVLVVTGKGSVMAGGGAIRNAAPGWLNAPRLRPRILAFAEAVPRDGGAGALYVLLRRPERTR